jgi:diazepam-binding inhibitor (GABA receptor modulating acyl-CoA-binding protein)
MSLDERFKKAVWLVRNGPQKEASNDTKLNFYKYYKQATEGDVTGSQVSLGNLANACPSL